jgi:hypothetical protein
MNAYLHVWHLAEFLLEWELFQTNVIRENQNTHFMFNNFFFFRKLCRLWDNVQKCCRAGEATDDHITRRMRFACWITMVTNTLTICNTYCFSTATMVTRTCLNVTLYIACLVSFLFSLDTGWEPVTIYRSMACFFVTYRKTKDENLCNCNVFFYDVLRSSEFAEIKALAEIVKVEYWMR